MIAWWIYGYTLAIVGRIERFFGLGNYPETTHPLYRRGYADGRLAERADAGDPREIRDRRYRDHVAACTDPKHHHPELPS